MAKKKFLHSIYSNPTEGIEDNRWFNNEYLEQAIILTSLVAPQCKNAKNWQ